MYLFSEHSLEIYLESVSLKTRKLLISWYTVLCRQIVFSVIHSFNLLLMRPKEIYCVDLQDVLRLYIEMFASHWISCICFYWFQSPLHLFVGWRFFLSKLVSQVKSSQHHMYDLFTFYRSLPMCPNFQSSIMKMTGTNKE